MNNILIVEDEKMINNLVCKSLQTIGYCCFQAFYGMEALAILDDESVDLVLLDIQLPDIDGYSLIRKIKDIPVIYLTARDAIEDRVQGLNLGAEDYIIKPFAIDELIARIQVVLRRFNIDEEIFQLDNLSVSLPEKRVKLLNRDIELTPQEFSLLEAFIQHKNMALSREQLLQLAWGYDYLGDDRTVDVHVGRIRKKLQLEKHLKTVYKLGYRLEVK